MGVSTTGEITGIPDMIRALRQIDPELRKEAAREIRILAKPMVASARGRMPVSVPMSGWTRGRTAFVPSKARTGIKAAVRFTPKRGSNEIKLITLKQVNPAGEIFDMAGRAYPGGKDTKGGRRGDQFVANLPGRASRVIWPTVERFGPSIQKNLADAAAKMERTINEKTSK
jgi:hypothetical protein